MRPSSASSGVAVLLLWSATLLFIHGSITKREDEVSIEIDEHSDPVAVATESCRGEHASCMFVAANAIERYQALQYNKSLVGWRFNEHCNCSLPPRPAKQDILQFMHIPKTGTAFNWFLRDYFDNCTDREGVDDGGDDDEPCTRWLRGPEDQIQGLCGGRLYSCAGHRVDPELVAVAASLRTNLVTLLRHPWARLSSDFHYYRRRPDSAHLSPEIDPANLVASTRTVLEHALYPGIANCATKMLNGIQCGAVPDPPLNDTHLAIAKEMLLVLIFVGITEHFRSSVCLMAWMHGGDPVPRHFAVSRKGDYAHVPITAALSTAEQALFNHSERFDLALYDYGRAIFLNRLQLAGCPLYD